MSQSESPRREGADRVTLLEQQLQEMLVVLEAERQRHREEAQAQATKLRLLEAQVRDREAAGPKSNVQAPNLSRGGPRLVASTPRTADHLFVAMPSDSARGAGGSSASRPASASASASARGTTRSSVTAATAQRRAAKGAVGTAETGAQRSTAKTPNASPERSRQTAPASRATALQHAWDKFCLSARQEFTPHELALVSAETLQSLMDHYKVRSSIERAQIEGQWALLQEGKSTVGDTATPKPNTSAKRAAIKRAEHEAPFDLGGELGKPHLTKRALLGAEGIKPSNPNESTSGSGLVRSHSSTILIKPREAGPSNPNETQAAQDVPRLCFRRTQSPGPGKETPRGMKHVQPNESGDYTPRGIRTNGSTHMGGDAQRSQGVRCNIGVDGNTATPRRGVRTFDTQGSPTRVRPYSIHVTTPPHLERTHLLTHTLGHCGDKQNKLHRATSYVERRTPFALGDN